MSSIRKGLIVVTICDRMALFNNQIFMKTKRRRRNPQYRERIMEIEKRLNEITRERNNEPEAFKNDALLQEEKTLAEELKEYII